MATAEIEGKIFEVDGDGFLTSPQIWNEEVARLFAKYDGIAEMNDKHWAIIKIIRNCPPPLSLSRDFPPQNAQ